MDCRKHICRNLIWLTLYTISDSALAVSTTSPLSLLPLPSRLSIWGSTGTNSFGEGDAMIPLLGNRDQIFFADAVGKYGESSSWLASLGLGGRTIINSTIVGGYVFTDFNKTPNGNNFTVLNPGIEWMTYQWDAHVNGYIPIGSKSKLMGIFTGEQVGISNTVYFSGHSQYDSLFDQLETAGSGVDLELGHTLSFFNKTRIFAGGYFFNPAYSTNINGVEAGFEIPLTTKWASVEVRDSYDNLNHNTFLLTMRLTFGGIDKTNNSDVHDRMLDRIPRHLANLYNGDGIPSEVKIVNTGRSTLVTDNLWFFNAGGTPSKVQDLQSCTFEHPCVGLDQTQIDTINTLASNANFYMSSGTYNNPATGTGFNFYNGQNVYGRNHSFTSAATGDNRPLLNDSLSLNGNNNISNLRINANSTFNIITGGATTVFRTGVFATTTATGTININDSEIFSTSISQNTAGVINNSPTSTVNVNDSKLTSSLENVPGGIAVAAGNVSGGTLNLKDSTIEVTETGLDNNFSLAFGAVNNENGVINIENTNIMVNSKNAGLSAAILNNSTTNPGVVNIRNSELTVIVENGSTSAAVFNQANNTAGLGGTVNIDQSKLTIQSNNGNGNTGAGVVNNGESTVNIKNSTIESNGNTGTIVGIINGNALSTVNFQSTSILVDLSGTATGVPIANSGVLHDQSQNQCFLNGAPVSC